VDHADIEGWTALRAAAWGGHSQVIIIYTLIVQQQMIKFLICMSVLGCGVIT